MTEEKIDDEQVEQINREQDIKQRRMADQEQHWKAKMIEERQKTRKREGRDPKTGKLIDTQGVDILRLSKLDKIKEVVEKEGLVAPKNLEKATVHEDEIDLDKLNIRYWIEEYNRLNNKYKLVRDTLLNFCRPQIQGIKETHALFLLLQGLDKEREGDI